MEYQRTIIIGLGNPYLGDDGIGVVIAKQIQETLPIDRLANVTVTEASVGGLRLMETLEGFDRAILIDALDSPDPVPGRIHHWSLEDLIQISPTQHSASAHDTNLPTALEAGRQMGLKLPKEISIYAIEVRCLDEFSEVLTQEVGESIPIVFEQVMHEIGHDTVVQTQATAWR